MAEVADESWWIKIGAMYDGSGFKAAIGGIYDLRRAATNLYEAFRKVIDANSDLYLSAKYLNVPTDTLQTWERAFRLMGGSADEARDAISSLNFVYDKLRLGMDQGAAETAARLFLRPEELTSFENIMKGLNRSYNEIFQGDYGAFKTLAEQLGLSQSAILMVTQNTQDFNRLLKEANRIPLIPEHQLRAARELNKQFTQLKITWESFKASLISTALPGLNTVFQRLGEILQNPELMDRLQEVFKSLEEGFNRLATDENITTFLNLVDKSADVLIKLLDWGASGTKWVADRWEKNEAIDEQIKAQTGLTHEQRLSGALMGSFGGYALAYDNNAAGTVNVTQNITIDGAKDPAAVGKEVVEQGRQGYEDANTRARAIQARALVTAY